MGCECASHCGSNCRCKKAGRLCSKFCVCPLKCTSRSDVAHFCDFTGIALSSRNGLAILDLNCEIEHIIERALLHKHGVSDEVANHVWNKVWCMNGFNGIKSQIVRTYEASSSSSSASSSSSSPSSSASSARESQNATQTSVLASICTILYLQSDLVKTKLNHFLPFLRKHINDDTKYFAIFTEYSNLHRFSFLIPGSPQFEREKIYLWDKNNDPTASCYYRITASYLSEMKSDVGLNIR